MKNPQINVGLLGLGRLGKVYARDLSSRIAQTKLVAVCDIDSQTLHQVVTDYRIPAAYSDPRELIADNRVEAVAIVTSTHTHRELVEACAAAGKPVFCEKPLSLSLSEALAMKRVVEKAGILFQMGFMRRFDRGYAAAKAKMDQGLVGSPVVFKSTSRDPSRPSLEYLNPSSSGGIFVDMGIHDFDLALWLFGKIVQVWSIGGVLAYPEVKKVGDIDNAIVSITFVDGRIGVVDLSRNGVYGYDIATEILGTAGTLRIGYLRETPIMVMTKNKIAHDTVPFFMERFAEAYTSQLRSFAETLLHDKRPPVTIDDGIEALKVAIAATRSYQTRESVRVDSVDLAKPFQSAV